VGAGEEVMSETEWDKHLWAEDAKLLKACEDDLPKDEEFGLPDEMYWWTEQEAVRAARDDNQWIPLAEILRHETAKTAPLSEEARELIASKLLDEYKGPRKRPKLTTAQRLGLTPTHEAFAAYQQIERCLEAHFKSKPYEERRDKAIDLVVLHMRLTEKQAEVLRGHIKNLGQHDRRRLPKK
jgi:hypothetical protein